MSEFGQIAHTLGTMTQAQLLTAFGAGGAYMLAQGKLLDARPRRFAWMATVTAAAAFVLQSSAWAHALILCALAVGGLGALAALVWLTSRWLGLARTAPVLDDGTPGVQVNASNGWVGAAPPAQVAGAGARAHEA